MKQVEALLDRFVADFDRLALPEASVVLHGSAARGQYLPGWSDVNLLILLEGVTTNTLEALRPLLRWWKEEARSVPLLLSRAEWRRAADAYPLEIAEMRTGYRVLRGGDPLMELVVRPADLRLALEREFRGKLLRLRQAYALLGDDGKALGTVARRSVSPILLLCRGLLVLAGESPPDDPVDLVNRAGAVAGFGGPAVARVVTRRGQEDWACTEAEFQGYLAAVETAAGFVDNHQIGEHQ